jgi:hypothetical protein
MTKPALKKAIAFCGGFIAIVFLWTFDPNVWKVRSRFPSAVIRDWSDWSWVLPGFLHSRDTSYGLSGGYYLNVTISNELVALNRLNDIPFTVLQLKHCNVTGLENIAQMHIGNNRGIVLYDCDVSGNPGTRIPGIPDSHHATIDMGGP